MSNWRLGWQFIKGIDILPHYAGGESGVRAAAQKGAILFHKREWPPLNPPRERLLIGSLRLESPFCLRNETACAALPRLELLDDLPLLLSSAAALLNL